MIGMGGVGVSQWFGIVLGVAKGRVGAIVMQLLGAHRSQGRITQSKNSRYCRVVHGRGSFAAKYDGLAMVMMER